MFNECIVLVNMRRHSSRWEVMDRSLLSTCVSYSLAVPGLRDSCRKTICSWSWRLCQPLDKEEQHHVDRLEKERQRDFPEARVEWIQDGADREAAEKNIWWTEGAVSKPDMELLQGRPEEGESRCDLDIVTSLSVTSIQLVKKAFLWCCKSEQVSFSLPMSKQTRNFVGKLNQPPKRTFSPKNLIIENYNREGFSKIFENL